MSGNRTFTRVRQYEYEWIRSSIQKIRQEYSFSLPRLHESMNRRIQNINWIIVLERELCCGWCGPKTKLRPGGGAAVERGAASSSGAGRGSGTVSPVWTTAQRGAGAVQWEQTECRARVTAVNTLACWSQAHHVFDPSVTHTSQPLPTSPTSTGRRPLPRPQLCPQDPPLLRQAA